MRLSTIAAKYMMSYSDMRRRGLALLCFIILSLSILSCEKTWDNPADPQVKLDPPIVTVLSETDEAVRIALSHSLGDKVKIYYTLDGSEPDSGSDLYVDEIEVPKPFPLKAIALADQNTSNCISAEYLLIVSTPIFSLSSGTFFDIIRVEISCSTMDVQIRYTTDSSEPSENSTLYSSAIDITKSTLIKAKAYKEGWISSFTASGEYHVTQMNLIPAGSFTMGRTIGTGESDELPTHSVTLNSFYLGKYEVTQEEYAQYMQPSPSWISSYGLGDNYPAYNISWYAILKYCNLRSMAEGLTPVYIISNSNNPADWGAISTSSDSTWDASICNWSANGYRLPTEAEWEYAARGAANYPDYLYSGSDDINAVAWYDGNSGSTTHLVGTKAYNSLGLYDMSGNVYEWCWDWYGGTFYGSSPITNPTGPANGSRRMARGGSCSSSVIYCQVASRNYESPYGSNNNVGFRLCRSSP